eukprot:8599693-Pyramimonas_sp.AAC.1
MAKEWELAHDLPCFWGSRGRTCDRARWGPDFSNYLSSLNGFESATLFSDLEKFYERVSHFILMGESRAT